MKRWLWIIVAGLIIGGLAGLFVLRYQQTVYQASSRVMLIQQASNTDARLAYLSDMNRIETYSELLTSRPVLKEASERLGYPVSSRRVTAAPVGGVQIIEVAVVDERPERAAEIATTVIQVFIDQQDELHSSLYASTEESLRLQLAQVEEQMDALQRQAMEDVRRLRSQQMDRLERQIASLQAETRVLEQDLVHLQFSGTPVPGYNEAGRPGLVPPTPTLDERVKIAQINARLEEIKSLMRLYQDLHTDLTFGPGNQQEAGQLPGEVQISLAQYEEIYSNLLENYEEIRLTRMRNTPDFILVESAVPPERPISPKPLLNLLVGALLGGLAGFGVAFTRVYTDETFRTAEEARILLRLPVLASIPRQRARAGGFDTLTREEPLAIHSLPPTADERRGTAGEGLRFLRANLDNVTMDQPARTLLVASPDDSPVSAWLSAHLAMMVAKTGRRVLLLDADLRCPHIATLFGLGEQCGLGEVLENKADLESVIQTTQDDCLNLITSGQLAGDPADKLTLPVVRPLVQQLRQQADLVILNSPPFAFAEAASLAAAIDAVVLAIELDRTRSTAALATMEQLALSRARVIGLVIV